MDVNRLEKEILGRITKRLSVETHAIKLMLHHAAMTRLMDGHLRKINQSVWWRLGMWLSNLSLFISKAFKKNKPCFDLPLDNSEVEKFNNSVNKSIVAPFQFDILEFNPAPRIGVFVHVFFIDKFLEIYLFLKVIPYPFDLYISTDNISKKEQIIEYFSEWKFGKISVELVPNKGRDVAPKLVLLKRQHENYDYVLHLHTKASDASVIGHLWLPYILNCLLGDENKVRSILEIFRSCPEVGVIGSENFFMTPQEVSWGENLQNCKSLLARMGIAITECSPLDFPAGSMFWARPCALKPLFDLNLSLDDFPEELGQYDATLAHALERLIFYSAELAGFKAIHVSDELILSDTTKKIIVPAFDQLAAKVALAESNLLPNTAI